jgi:predicted enzyme related to lactoylglutathione lyase
MRAPVVHLELHTGDLRGARELYRELCGWRPARVDTCHGSYEALPIGGAIGGGMVECQTKRSLWLPYVEVDDVDETVDRARVLGASILLEPRDGPSGRRAVVATPAGGELAFWQPKR